MSPEFFAALYSEEDTNVEYKETMVGDKIKPTIVAFANDWQDDGVGTLIIGVANGGAIVGLKQSQDQILQMASNWQYDGSIDPRPQLTVDTETVDGKLLCKIRVPTGQRRPYRFNGTCYVRIGTSTRPATFEEEVELSKRPTIGHSLPNTLPPRDQVAVDFVGRKRDLQSLQTWIQDPLSNRISLIGPGGSGKSALAYEFACQIIESALAPITMVLWISAKYRRLTEGVILPIHPDFYGLETALDKLLVDTGWEELLDTQYSILERRNWIIDVFAETPALIILDDYDTLLANGGEPDVARCIDFFQGLTARTGSKLVMTSRVDTRAGQQHRVQGFRRDSSEALQFVDSRLRLLGMEEESLSRDAKNAVLRTTDGIPLFVEDVLRHYRLIQHLDRTLDEWKIRSGQSAREFALRLEFDSLNEVSKAVLLTCCLLETEVSIDDVQAVTGYGAQDIEEAMLELQGLFLVSPPSEANEYKTFAVTTNTAQLVKQELLNRSEYRRIEDAVRSISGDVYKNQFAEQHVNQAFRRAYWYVRSERFAEAENVIRETFARPGLSQHPDLHSALGWVYKQWHPERRAGEAREHFQRAASLKCRKVEMYIHWTDLAMQEQNWSEVVEAGRQGLELKNLSSLNRMALGSSVGFATSQLGKRLGREMQTSKALQTLSEADVIFREYICDPSDVPERGWRTHGKLYSGLVQNDEALYRISDDRKWFERMIADLERWKSEHTDDPKLESEYVRIHQTYSNLV